MYVSLSNDREGGDFFPSGLRTRCLGDPGHRAGLSRGPVHRVHQNKGGTLNGMQGGRADTRTVMVVGRYRSKSSFAVGGT